MDAGLGGLAGGALGGISSGAFGYFGQRDANRASRDIAHDQMVFQERMSSTAHQREVEDLRKAGLNPVLSAGGGGSSTPGGAGAMVGNELEAASSSAAMLPRLAAELGQIKAQTEATKASAEVDRANKRFIEANTTNAFTQGRILASQAYRSEWLSRPFAWMGRGADWVQQKTGYGINAAKDLIRAAEYFNPFGKLPPYHLEKERRP